MERKVGLGAKFYFWKLNFVLYVAGIAITLIGTITTFAFIIISINIKGDVSQEEYENIIKNGKALNGIIHSVEIKKNMTANGSHPANIGFQIIGDNSKTHNVFTFCPQITDTLKPGDIVDLKVLEDKVVVMGLKPREAPPQILLFTLGLTFIGLIIFSVLNYKSKNLMYLIKKGIIQKGTITAKRDITHKPSGVTYSYNPSIYLIKYSYQDSNGKQISGQGKAPGSAKIKKLKFRESVSILVDPKDESNSTLFPYKLAKRYNWK